MNPNLFINLFASCTITKGYNRSIFVDFQRKQYWFIPNEWETILNHKKTFTIKEIYAKLHFFQDKIAIDSFLRFMIENELVFTSATDLSENFPPVSNHFETPHLIHTVSVNQRTAFPLISRKTISQLRANYLIIHCLDKFDLPKLLSHYSKSRIKGIEITIDLMNFSTPPSPNDLINSELRIHAIHFLNANKKDTTFYKNTSIHYYKTPVSNVNHRFKIDLLLSNESHHKHTYFNQRVHIDANGDIKNAKHTPIVFGNIHKDEIVDIVSKKGFQKLWNAKKIDMDDCSVCEFRNICVDKRIPKQRKDKTWYSIEECTYNPFINKEVGESNYKTLKDSGIQITPSGFSIEMEQFITTKSEIWG